MTTAILTSYYNYNRDQKKRDLLKKFIQFISDTTNVKDLYLCQLSDNSTYENIEIPNHHVLRNMDRLWHKESAINYLLKLLPKTYDNVVVCDADIILSDKQWIKKTEQLLSSNLLVQPFEYVKYLGPNENLIDNFYPGLVKHLETNNNIDYGNPGICLAYKRDYLDNVGGLFDKCILGGGDTINVLAFFLKHNFIKYSIFDRVFSDQKYELMNYLDRCEKLINSTNTNVAYIEDCVAIHGFHGAIKNRQYDTRYDLLRNSGAKDLVYKNSDGFYRINKNTAIGNIFHNLVNNLFSSREAWHKEEDVPIIFNTNKHGITDNIFWLSDNDYFTFSNIKKIKLHCRKEKDIKYLHMFANSEKISANFRGSDCIIEIDNPKTLSINADYYIPKEIGEGEDVRKLSIYLTKIEIMPTDSESYVEYRVRDIF